MWHEARKQEKKIRGLMVDMKKRAERRREFYERIKADPTQFLRVYGRPYKIHLESAVAMAAEGPQTMMPWQGNTDNMIDRFDVRAHLDIINEHKSTGPPKLDYEEREEERMTSYERYRTLVENECAGVSEEQSLYQIYIDEQFGPPANVIQEKKKSTSKKAAIGYKYEDSTPALPVEEEDSEEESDATDIEDADLDVMVDVDLLNDDQAEQMNRCSYSYGMADDDYIRLLRQDKEEQDVIRQARMLEEEKAQFAGRKSRRERRAYKEKRMVGRPLSPPSYAARASPKYEPFRKSSSSRSRSPDPKAPVTFITSFGSDSDGERGVMHGPALAPHMIAKEKSVSKRKTCHTEDRQRHSSSRQRNWHSRSRSPPERWRTPPERRRTPPERRRTPPGRQYSRMSPGGPRSRTPPGRQRYGYRRSRSRSREQARYNLMSRDRYKPRPNSRSRSRSRSRDQPAYRATNRTHDSRYPRERSPSLSRGHRSRSASSSSYSRSRSRSASKSRSKSKSRSPEVQTVVKSYRRPSLSSSSGFSDSENDDKNHTPQDSSAHNKAAGRNQSAVSYAGKASSNQKITPQERLKRRMQVALKKQYKADKKADTLKQERKEQERLDREDELRARAVEMRKRERERRHLEADYDNSDSYSGGDDTPKRRRSVTPPPPQQKFRSRSTSKERAWNSRN